MQARSPGNSQGIDVSHWQGDINWGLVKNNDISFAYIKATEGTDYVDQKFSKNVREAKKAGILIGAYHFCTPADIKDSINEANHYINIVNKYTNFDYLDLPPVIDIEKNNGLAKNQISKIIRTWVDKVEAETGVQPIIYSYAHFIKDYLDASLNNIPLWLAHYDSIKLPDFLPWRHWMFLQYTDKGQVSGISGNVDMNEFSGGKKELNWLCRRQT
jgi:lysozyme